MKQLSFVLVLALLACSGGSKPSPSSPPSTGVVPGAPARGCAQEIALRCEHGVDGCVEGKTTEHVCVPPDATPGPPCEQEIAKVCPDGQSDGCLRTPPVSANHICVYN